LKRKYTLRATLNKNQMNNFNKKIQSIIRFYIEGFTSLSPWARTLWAIILVKLFIMFVVFKLFFFRDTLKNRFNTDEERSDYVIEQITNTKPINND
jgi:hypothetical protein